MKNIDLRSQLTSLVAKARPLWRYRLVAFVLFVTLLCGYLVLQINHAVSVPASNDVISTGGKRAGRIDPQVVKQLKQLQDNSVSVKALFNESRENPFQ